MLKKYPDSKTFAVKILYLDCPFQLDEVLLDSPDLVQSGANNVFVKALRSSADVGGGESGRKRRSASSGVEVEAQIAFMSDQVNATAIDDAFATSNISSETAQSISNDIDSCAPKNTIEFINPFNGAHNPRRISTKNGHFQLPATALDSTSCPYSHRRICKLLLR